MYWTVLYHCYSNLIVPCGIDTSKFILCIKAQKIEIFIQNVSFLLVGIEN